MKQIDKVLRLIAFITIFYACYAEENDTNLEAKVIEELLTGYNSRAFPHHDKTAPLVVHVFIQVRRLQSLDENEQILTTHLSLTLEWYDHYLRSKTQEPGTFVILNNEDVWKPSVMLANSVNEDNDLTSWKLAKVRRNYSGHLSISIPRKFSTFCVMNLKYFPFDTQICDIEFINYIRMGVNEEPKLAFYLSNSISDSVLYQRNDEWDLLGIKLSNKSMNVRFSSQVSITYPTFKATLKVKRRPTFYVLILGVPSAVIGGISVIGFLLPSESGEKVSMQLTAIMSYVLLLLVLVDIVPPIGGNLPVIAWLLIWGLMISTINLFLTVMILRMFHRESSAPAPHWLKVVAFRIIAPITRFDIKRSENHATDEHILQKALCSSKLISKTVGQESESTDKSENLASSENVLKLYETFKQLEKEDSEKNITEWQIISKVFDKFLFIFNVIACSLAFMCGYIMLLT